MTQPKTIHELQQVCDELGLPLYHLHITIGQDVTRLLAVNTTWTI